VLDTWLFNAVSQVRAADDAWLTNYNEFLSHDSPGTVPSTVFTPRVFDQEVTSSELST